MIAQLAGVKPTMCCENARSHHSPFSRFPPRSMFITPRSHHSSLLVQCSARALLVLCSPLTPRSPRFTNFPVPLVHCSLSPRSRSLLRALSSLRVPRSSFSAHHSLLLVLRSSFPRFPSTPLPPRSAPFPKLVPRFLISTMRIKKKEVDI